MELFIPVCLFLFFLCFSYIEKITNYLILCKRFFIIQILVLQKQTNRNMLVIILEKIDKILPLMFLFLFVTPDE